MLAFSCHGRNSLVPVPVWYYFTYLCSISDAFLKTAWVGVAVTGSSWALTNRIPQTCRISSSLTTDLESLKNWRRTRTMVARSRSYLVAKEKSLSQIMKWRENLLTIIDKQNMFLGIAISNEGNKPF